jgi:hypothetical protein
MRGEKFDIGDWVEAYHKGKKEILLGYVLSICQFEAKVYVPKHSREFILPLINIRIKENIELDQEDLETLINLALDHRDFTWLARIVSS